MTCRKSDAAAAKTRQQSDKVMGLKRGEGHSKYANFFCVCVFFFTGTGRNFEILGQ